jgi:hypothetical protein
MISFVVNLRLIDGHQGTAPCLATSRGALQTALDKASFEHLPSAHFTACRNAPFRERIFKIEGDVRLTEGRACVGPSYANS